MFILNYNLEMNTQLTESQKISCNTDVTCSSLPNEMHTSDLVARYLKFCWANHTKEHYRNTALKSHRYLALLARKPTTNSSNVSQLLKAHPSNIVDMSPH